MCDFYLSIIQLVESCSCLCVCVLTRVAQIVAFPCNHVIVIPDSTLVNPADIPHKKFTYEFYPKQAPDKSPSGNTS